MAPARKKQRLSDNGTVATEASEDAAQQGNVAAAQSTGDGKVEQRRSLFVRSLPATTTTEALTELFSESYPIKHAQSL